MLIYRQNQKLIQQHNPPDRRLYLFFSGRNRQNRAPNRQTTVSFFFPVVMYLFFPVVMKISRHNKKTANFPPTDDCIFFFPVVIKISRHYKKNANFPPEPKTDTTAQPARQTTVSFFYSFLRPSISPSVCE